VVIQFQIPNHTDIHDGLHDRETLGEEISEPPLDKVLIPELKDFLLALDLGFSQGGRHVECTPHWTGSNVTKGSAIPHLLLKSWRKSPKEEPRTLVPMPI
jgi:hypothetical protein